MREDWIEVELGEIAKIYNGNSINARLKEEKYAVCKTGLNYIGTKDVAFDGRIEYENGVKIPIDEPKFKIAPKGCVLVCSEGGSAGRKIGYIDEDVCFGNKLYAITNEYSVFEGKYVYYYTRYRKFFQAFKGQLNGIIGGVSAKKFSNIKIDLSPLPEQKAIVAKIEELFSDLDKGIADLRKAQDQLKIYRQAVLKKAFEGELTKEWRKQQSDLPTADELLEQIKAERQKHYEQQLENWKQAVKAWEENGKEGKKPGKPKLLKDPDKIEANELDNYNNLPDSWLWSRLANTVVDHSSDIVDGPFGSNLKSTEYQDEGKPILRIQNIKSNQFINKNIKFVTEEKYNFLKRHQFKPNDVIVTKLGDPLGLACRVPLDFTSGVIVADLIRIRPSSKHINYDWLTLLINSIVIQSQFRRITKGTTRPRMNLTIMRNTIVPLPAYKEQHQIVQEIESRLSVCDKVEQSITESLEKAKALRQSILKKAFEGTLLSIDEIAACKAAPDYEPASSLLEKIKTKQ